MGYFRYDILASFSLTLFFGAFKADNHEA